MAAPIRVLDHCLSLILRIHGRADDDAIDEEIDKVCLELFGATRDDIPAAARQEWARNLDWRLNLVDRCLAQGFDLRVGSTKATIERAEDFGEMVWARARGLLPKTPEERDAWRFGRGLQADADAYRSKPNRR